MYVLHGGTISYIHNDRLFTKKVQFWYIVILLLGGTISHVIYNIEIQSPFLITKVFDLS